MQCSARDKKISVLVIHGGPGSLSMADDLEPLWKGRPVYSYDQFGCGNSDGKENNYFC
jgi:pimeloyl-ACP methyl ester carboxylesterase